MTPDLFWSRIWEYGILVFLLSVATFTAYKRLWVSGSFHDKYVEDLKKEHESEISMLRSDKDKEIDRLRHELTMWRDMAIDGLRTAQLSNQTAKGVMDLVSNQAIKSRE